MSEVTEVMEYFYFDLKIRKMALDYAFRHSTNLSENAILIVAQKFENYLRNGEISQARIRK